MRLVTLPLRCKRRKKSWRGKAPLLDGDRFLALLSNLLREVGLAFFIIILLKQNRFVGCKERSIIGLSRSIEQ